MRLPATCDLSPLLQCAHLTRLFVHDIAFADTEAEASPRASPQKTFDHSLVLRQLTKLRFLHLRCCRSGDVHKYFPEVGNDLEEFCFPGRINETDLKIVAERSPKLLVITPPAGRLSDNWNLVDHTVLGEFQSLRSLKYGLRMFHRDGLFSIGLECIQAFGSLQSHVDHVISILGGFRCLTELDLGDMFTPKSSPEEEEEEEGFGVATAATAVAAS